MRRYECFYFPVHFETGDGRPVVFTVVLGTAMRMWIGNIGSRAFFTSILRGRHAAWRSFQIGIDPG